MIKAEREVTRLQNVAEWKDDILNAMHRRNYVCLACEYKPVGINNEPCMYCGGGAAFKEIKP